MSGKTQVLQDIDSEVEAIAYAYALASSSEEEDEYEEDLEDLLDVREAITSNRYLLPRSNVEKHDTNILETYIREYSDTTFLSLFRMHRESFWQVVEILAVAGGQDYWVQTKTGRPSRPIYQQIAVVLYVLGGGGSTGERTRLALNIGKGAVLAYTWRTVNLLATLVPTYIRWPHSVEHPVQSGQRVFSRCIGFLDGTNIILRNKPTVDPEAYFSRKKNYGFNLQAICDWEGRFIWVSMKHTASVHATAFFL